MYLTNNTIEIRAETDEEAEKLHEIKTRLEETRPNDRLGKLQESNGLMTKKQFCTPPDNYGFYWARKE